MYGTGRLVQLLARAQRRFHAPHCFDVDLRLCGGGTNRSQCFTNGLDTTQSAAGASYQLSGARGQALRGSRRDRHLQLDALPKTAPAPNAPAAPDYAELAGKSDATFQSQPALLWLITACRPQANTAASSRACGTASGLRDRRRDAAAAAAFPAHDGQSRKQ